MSNDKRQRTKVLTLVLCFVVIPLLLVAIALIRPAVAQTPKHYTELTFPPLRDIQIPDYTRFKLSNGMVVYLMEDHELPLVGGTLLVRTGARLEPSAQVGLASLMATVLRTGGTQSRQPDEINQFLEQRAASVEAGMGMTSGNAGFNALSENLDEVFSLFSEIVRQPAFAADKLALAKRQAQGGIARRNDDPNGIAGREFQKLIYGDTSPYARTVEYTTLNNISRADLIRFYQTYYHPNNMMLGIVGDFDTAQMRQLVEAKLGDWQPQPKLTVPPVPPVSQAKKRNVFLVDQPQLTQSSIQMGHLGGKLDSPDYAALSVMNEVLNGFGGRLFNEVRSRQGLAYSVYAYWGANYDYPGVFTAGGQTRSDATVAFIQSVQNELKKIRQAPIEKDELQYAKDIVLNSFIFNFQSPEQTLSRLMRYEYFGYPEDFIFRYRKAVEATTIADVQRVAKTYLNPEQLVTLVVGNAAQIQPPLASLGPDVTVTKVDVTIPPPASPPTSSPTSPPTPSPRR